MSLASQVRKPTDHSFSQRPSEVEDGMEVTSFRKYVVSLEEGIQMERDEARRANQKMEERIKKMEQAMARMILERQTEVQDGKGEAELMSVDEIEAQLRLREAGVRARQATNEWNNDCVSHAGRERTQANDGTRR